MGKKKETMKAYLAKKGFYSRKIGMYKQESRSRKVCICFFFALSTVLCILFGGVYAHRATNAGKINKDFPQIWDDLAQTYDSCAANG